MLFPHPSPPSNVIKSPRLTSPLSIFKKRNALQAPVYRRERLLCNLGIKITSGLRQSCVTIVVVMGKRVKVHKMWGHTHDREVAALSLAAVSGDTFFCDNRDRIVLLDPSGKTVWDKRGRFWPRLLPDRRKRQKAVYPYVQRQAFDDRQDA